MQLPAVAVALIAGSAGVAGEVQMWRGRLTYPGCTTDVPLDIQWDTTASSGQPHGHARVRSR